MRKGIRLSAISRQFLEGFSGPYQHIGLTRCKGGRMHFRRLPICQILGADCLKQQSALSQNGMPDLQEGKMILGRKQPTARSKN
jgi:hypothetical protein